MKRVFAAVLILGMLALIGCNSRIPQTAAPTNAMHSSPSAESTDPLTSSNSTTTSTIPPTTSLPENAVGTPIVADLTAKFSEYGSWYNMALTCLYNSPAELNLKMFFDFGGFKDESPEPTDQEWAQLKDLPYFSESMDFVRLPVSKINAVLTEYFGITVDDLEEDSFRGLQYLEDTDCYYYMTTGVNYTDSFSVTKTEVLEDGCFRLYYTGPFHLEFLNDPDVLYVVTLKPNGSNYLILSNIPAN